MNDQIIRIYLLRLIQIITDVNMLLEYRFRITFCCNLLRIFISLSLVQVSFGGTELVELFLDKTLNRLGLFQPNYV